MNIGPLELIVLATVSLLGLVLVVVPAARICRRAGFSPWLGVLAVVPVANIVLLWYLAFTEWPRTAMR